MEKVLWFTGLSGAGKTTIAEALKERLTAIGKKVLILDGDVVRNTINKNLGFSRDDIHKNNVIIANIAKEKSGEFDFILIPIISPYDADRSEAKKIIGKGFLLLYIKCSLNTCIERDVKGLYKKAKNGEINNLIGFSESNKFEIPEKPDITINTELQDLETSLETILGELAGKNE